MQARRQSPVTSRFKSLWFFEFSPGRSLPGWALCFATAMAMGLAGQADAQRLPDTVHPDHYTLQLTPDLKAATFAGEETIDVTLTGATDAVTLNAAEIHFGEVAARIEGSGAPIPGRVTLDAAKEQATLHFAQSLPAGQVTLAIKYTGILNNELRGFYLSKTPQRNYAVTQFEPTDARRAFPSFDEPEMKATFDVTLIVDKGDTAISNTNILSDMPGPGAGQHTLRFARTPKMSTYLVAFLVGDFKCLSGKSDDVPVRVCATPSQVQDGAFALSAAEFFLHYYDDYFGIKYPMPKLDMIALPDFEAGAMENFGAITYRERALLLDPATAPLAAQRNVAIDVAHEMAHQWFGDMVTMNWWDNIWLNEGFATWMQSKAVAMWKPDWRMPENVAAEMNDTLDLDALGVTRAIRAKADTPDEINQMFDGITYEKAAAVLRMTENYVGEEAFARGVHRYLEAHMYANATAEDFWNAQTEVSGKPVDKIMGSLVTQPGEPLLTFGPPQDEKVGVTQQRFFLNPKNSGGGDMTWTLPICMKKDDGGSDCQILSDRRATLNVPEGKVFYANAGGKGYYRSQYSPADYRKLVSQVETALSPEERITLLGSEWALTRAEKTEIGDFLNLAGAVKDDGSPYVLDPVTGALETMDQQIVLTPEDHRLLAAWIRKTFAGALAAVGQPSPDEAPEKKQLRAELFGLLGAVGDDPEVLAQATQLAGQYLQNPASVDPTLAAAAIQVAAQNGNEALFNQLLEVSQTANNPQLQSRALYALARFRDPALQQRALQYAVSGKVKNQDAGLLLALELSDRSTQDAAWRFIEENWAQVHAQMTVSTGEDVVEATGSFCSVERRTQVSDFFAQHSMEASGGTLVRAQSAISDCIELRTAQGQRLKDWLQADSQPPAKAAATDTTAAH
ncbi:MAG TPA: M1 family metallopeptidase [Acidobacteriaceae bacterium]|nr:M1 family metallopeptidase [Acidobacteriaceae bacterium]